MKKFTLYIISVLALTLSACSERDVSNKTERNAIRHGNELYKKSKFTEAVADYRKALESNPQSEAARYNLSMAMLHDPKSDTTAMKNAHKELENLGEHAQDPAIAERALYNLGNHAVYIGDAVKEAGGTGEGGVGQDMSKQYYLAAIEYYKKLLRRNPRNIRALQNLRIAQLKLPPEDQNGGGGGNNDQQQKQQDQQQQQQQQEQQQEENQNDQQVLQNMQAKENRTRRDNPDKEIPAGYATDKPW